MLTNKGPISRQSNKFNLDHTVNAVRIKRSVRCDEQMDDHNSVKEPY